MSEFDAARTPGLVGPLGLESPTVPVGFDPGLVDRTPKATGPDDSMPDTRLALRNEAKVKAFMANRDKTLLDDPNLI